MAGEALIRQQKILEDIKAEPRTMDWLCDKYNREKRSIQSDIANINEVTLKDNGLQIKMIDKEYRIVTLEGGEEAAFSDEIRHAAEKNTAINVDKIIVLRAMQLLGKAATLDEIIEEYKRLRLPDPTDGGPKEVEKEKRLRDKVENTLFGSENQSLIALGLVDRVGDDKFEPSKQSPQYLCISGEKAEDIKGM